MKSGYKSDRIKRRKSRLFKNIIILAVILTVLAAVSIISYNIIYSRLHNEYSENALYDNWNLKTTEGFLKTYEIADVLIQKNPLNNTARTFRGYSAFMLAESEPDYTLSKNYLNDAITNLRIALIGCSKETYPQVCYMLGKAYYYRDKAASYSFYADLTVKYLNEALDNGFSAPDIPHLLGLSYDALGETDKSIAALTKALINNETDTLLYDIGRQYFKNKQGMTARQYLARVIHISKNDELIEKSRLLLGQIYMNEGEYQSAENEFNSILEKNENSADAHYELGVLYEKLGYYVKARYEWRQCRKIQVNHPGATKKLLEARK